MARVLLPGIITYSIMPAMATLFSQQLGRPRIPLIFSSISTVVCAALTVLLLPRFGIVGGAIATSISYCLAFSAAVIYFVRRTRIAPLRLFTLSSGELAPYRSLLVRYLVVL